MEHNLAKCETDFLLCQQRKLGVPALRKWVDPGCSVFTFRDASVYFYNLNVTGRDWPDLTVVLGGVVTAWASD